MEKVVVLSTTPVWSSDPRDRDIDREACVVQGVRCPECKTGLCLDTDPCTHDSCPRGL
jgi:hypothetical protein